MGFGSLFKKDETETRNELLRKGLELLYSGKYEKAMECFDKAIELSGDPPYPSPWIGKATILNILGNTEEAIKCLDKVIKMTDDYPDVRYSDDEWLHEDTQDYQALAWYNKGVMLLDGSEEALKCFDKAVELDPEFVDAWLNKGYTLHHLGKREESIMCIRKVLELDPNNELALTNIKAFGYEEYF